jgi:hypothetical protein
MSEEVTPKVGPNLADSPVSTTEDTKTFSYDVASQAGTRRPAQPNPNSPLAAG